MFVVLAICVILYLLYKWGIANNDYFEKKGVAFIKPTFLIGSNGHFFVNKMALHEVVQKWYKELAGEK